jgi:hypothetical protein
MQGREEEMERGPAAQGGASSASHSAQDKRRFRPRFTAQPGQQRRPAQLQP